MVLVVLDTDAWSYPKVGADGQTGVKIPPKKYNNHIVDTLSWLGAPLQRVSFVQ